MANTNCTPRSVTVEGYDVLAHCVCDFGRVVLLNNNQNWLGVCLMVEEDSPTATVVAEFWYAADPFVSTFRQAMMALTEYAIRNLSFEDGSDFDTDCDESPTDPACPGCGCLPGYGRTPGCTHPEGCGFELAQELPCPGCAHDGPECLTPWRHA